MTARRASLVLAVVLAVTAGPAREAQAQDLVADLSDYLISITSTFAGATIHAFGMIEPPADDTVAQDPPDIVLVLQGPPMKVTVREKKRIAGIWINREAVSFKDAPGYYYVASNRPLDDIAPRRVLARNHLGTTHVQITARRARSMAAELDEAPGDAKRMTAFRIGSFRDALIRAKSRDGLYLDNPEGVRILDGRLFRAEIDLPAQVPVGNYTATVFLLRGGAVIAAQTIPLYVERSDLEHMVYRFAHDTPLLYGIFSVLFAMLAGYGASALFKRR